MGRLKKTELSGGATMTGIADFDFPVSVDEFIKLAKSTVSDPTQNPLFKLAAVNMLLTRALQGALNAQADAVKLIASEIEAASKLSVRVLSYKTNSTNVKTSGKFGESKEDAKAMLDEMQRYGVALKDIKELYDQYNNASDPQVDITDATIEVIKAQINAYIESLNTRSSQEQLTLQSLTNRYTQAGEQASTVLQKDAQSKATLINNARGLA